MTYDMLQYRLQEQHQSSVQARMRLLFGMLPDAIDVPIRSVPGFNIPATDGGGDLRVVLRAVSDEYLNELDALVQECFENQQGNPRVSVTLSFSTASNVTPDQLVDAASTMLVQVEDGIHDYDIEDLDESHNEHFVASTWDPRVDCVEVNNICIFKEGVPS